MWGTTKISLEELRKIISDAILDLDPREFWMITWIDKVVLSDDGTPYIKVSVHRVKSIELEKFALESLDLKRPRWILIPLRLLRMFPVGTLFKDGVVKFRTHLTYLPHFTIDLDTGSNFERTTLAKWKHGEELIKAMSWSSLDKDYPFSEPKRFAAHSRVVVYPNFRRNNAKYDYIIFPSVELARFYWFPSTRLFKAMMDGQASSNLKNELYVPGSAIKRKLENGEEYHEILLRDQMHLRDIEFVARLAFSPDALKSANTIYQSVINSKLESGNKGPLHLDCIFPFNDETTLKVVGYTIQLNGVAVLMVTEIRECYGPWPFTSLRYDRETPRLEVDESHEKNGTKKSPPELKQDSPDENEEEREPEDELEFFVLNLEPLLKGEPGFDHSRKNNNRTKNVEYTYRGSRFPTMPKDKKRIDRKRIVPPKNLGDPKSVITDNISVNENEQKGGTSTNVDIVSEEKEPKLTYVDMPKYIEKLCERFRAKGEVDYVCLINQHDEESTKWHQKDQIGLQINLTGGSDIFLYIIYVRIPNHEFIICEMDRTLGTSLKIVTKYKLNGDGTTGFSGKDINSIRLAIVDNYKTLASLNDPEVKNGFKVKRLHHVQNESDESLFERIMEKVGVKDDSDA